MLIDFCHLASPPRWKSNPVRFTQAEDNDAQGDANLVVRVRTKTVFWPGDTANEYMVSGTSKTHR